MLAVLYVLFSEELVDRPFIAAHSLGMDLLERSRVGIGWQPGAHPALGGRGVRPARGRRLFASRGPMLLPNRPCFFRGIRSSAYLPGKKPTA